MNEKRTYNKQVSESIRNNIGKFSYVIRITNGNIHEVRLFSNTTGGNIFNMVSHYNKSINIVEESLTIIDNLTNILKSLLSELQKLSVKDELL